jgi:predicted SAM-dependent methyltransferase
VWRSRIRPVLVRSRTLRTGRARVIATWARVNPANRVKPFDGLPPAAAVRLAYEVLLAREPDPIGFEDYVTRITTGQITRRQLIESIRGSEEFCCRVPFSGPMLGHSVHTGRCQFIRGLPPARRILDLGGTHLANDVGAMVAMGYPYRFDELVIIDLPPDDRHPIYRKSDDLRQVQSHLGTVTYRYHSMTDLSAFADESFELFYSGQSIEHVTPDEGMLVMKEVHRVLRPGGHFALDTPNGRVTRLASAAFIDPDHKVEYTHAELSSMLADAGFAIVEAKGLNDAGPSLQAGRFDADAVASAPGLYAAIEDCYILAYVAQKPEQA